MRSIKFLLTFDRLIASRQVYPLGIFFRRYLSRGFPARSVHFLFLTFLWLGILQAKDPPIRVALLSAGQSLQPGNSHWIALSLAPEANYHTYWKAPGIVGVATAITWEKQKGVTFSALHWPAPERVLMASYPAHGYKKPILLLTRVTLASDYPHPEITLTAKANWMCCHTTCHPGWETLRLTLPVLKETPQPSSHADAIANTLKSLPQPAPADSPWTITWQDRDHTGSTLIIRGPAQRHLPTFHYYCERGDIRSDYPQTLTKIKPGHWTLHLPHDPDEAPPKKLQGLLEKSTPWHGQHTHLPIDLRWE